MFDSTPCGGGASIGNNVNNHGARHTIKEGHTFTDVVSLSVEPKELEGVVHLSVLSANKECEVRLPNNASSLTFTRATSQTGYTFHVDVKKDAIVRFIFVRDSLFFSVVRDDYYLCSQGLLFF